MTARKPDCFRRFGYDFGGFPGCEKRKDGKQRSYRRVAFRLWFTIPTSWWREPDVLADEEERDV